MFKAKKKTELKLQTDSLTIYIDGEYLPAKIEYHDNDVVSQFVVTVDDDLQFNPKFGHGIDDTEEVD